MLQFMHVGFLEMDIFPQKGQTTLSCGVKLIGYEIPDVKNRVSPFL